MKVSSLFLTLSLLVMAAPAFARDVKFKDLTVDWVKGDRLVVQGLRGSVKLIASGKGAAVVRGRKSINDGNKGTASERFDSLAFSARRESGVVIVEVRGPNTKQEWIDWSQSGNGDLNLEIEAPMALPAEVHLRSGTVTATAWRDALAVTLQDGAVRLNDGEGDVRVSLLRGEVKIEKQKGLVQVESHAAKVNLTSIDGDARVHNFGGDTAVTTVSGTLNLRTKTGTSSLQKIETGLDFDNGRGTLTGNGVKGQIRGATDEGAVNLQLDGEVDVLIEAQDGNIAVKPPSGFGVLLKLSTEEGAIGAPDSVSVPKTAGPKSVVARMDGTAKGTVVLRSKRGNIRIR